ncbi:5-(carboxyamino)imidazole ribonucleotide synthase [Acidipila sp. EB88]|uniref:5-(carboxyamino)imidazole ribonucleotide synthase n=1 Tax=Acidipila sp. EB88 TaxID=2305226 RepID=UPI000F5FAF80|nr:5-(carboxyamino)imidazole ribonucleotide synthase [Acidipila sp. EB88]RRA48216.1 5-(carboxyamino)imidazole ribonucleotide synthase [Acidipila sp. EB88]
MRKPILPGATIGILGGGQLGRMMAMAARSLGYRVQVMDPDPSCPARFVVDSCFEGSWSDAKAASNLARGCDVVTLEIEQISPESLLAAQSYAPVRPGPALMGIVQDRLKQKAWLAGHALPVGRYAAVRSLPELKMAVETLGPNIFLKSAHGGYDGRSQERLTGSSNKEVEAAWTSLGEQPCVAEQGLALRMEISVMVARSPSGEIRVFPSARNHHENQILVWSVLPSSISDELELRAQDLARSIAEGLALEGLVAVEMFVTETGDLLINELAPRPHNSYHASERACSTSQFEQAIRAVCDLPLGEVDIVRPAAIANLLGDLWQEHEPRWDRALAIPGVHLHLYEKHQPRKGRKMGHLSSTGSTPEQAVERVLEALAQL